MEVVCSGVPIVVAESDSRRDILVVLGLGTFSIMVYSLECSVMLPKGANTMV